MYNRYVRNDNGVYRRIPVAQEPHEAHRPAQEQEDPCRGASPERTPSHGAGFFGRDGLLSGILGKLKLDEIDTGDLLLLVLLFLLFRDGEDDELLIALGLLLIL